METLLTRYRRVVLKRGAHETTIADRVYSERADGGRDGSAGVEQRRRQRLSAHLHSQTDHGHCLLTISQLLMSISVIH